MTAQSPTTTQEHKSARIEVTREALFDSRRNYRFSLKREYAGGPGRHRTFYAIGCNPSTADDATDDHTIRKVVSMLRLAEEGGTLVMLNLDPTVMTTLSSRDLGEIRKTWGGIHLEAHHRNAAELRSALDAKMRFKERGITLIAAWGAVGEKYFSAEAEWLLGEVRSRGVDLACWGVTKKHGAPRHPLYLPRDTPLVKYGGPLEEHTA